MLYEILDRLWSSKDQSNLIYNVALFYVCVSTILHHGMSVSVSMWRNKLFGRVRINHPSDFLI